MHLQRLIPVMVVVLVCVLSPLTGQENVFQNPEFEESMEGWYTIGSDRASITDEQAYEGTHSLLSSHRTAAYEGPSQSLNRSMLDQHRYTLSAWVRIKEPVEKASVQMTIAQTDGRGTNYTATSSGLAVQ